MDRPIMPVMLQLNLGALVGEAVDAASVRAVIEVQRTRRRWCLYGPARVSNRRQVAFILSAAVG